MLPIILLILAAAPTFDPPRKLAGGSFLANGFTAPAVGDFNGDSLPDLVVAGGGKAGVYLNRGDAKYPRFDRLDVELPISTNGSVQAVDFNRDGLLDVLFRRTVFLNVGGKEMPRFDRDWQKGASNLELKFGPLPELNNDLNTNSALADVNGDGKLDLVLTANVARPQYVAYSTRMLVALDEGQGGQGVFGSPQWMSIPTEVEGKTREFADHTPYPAFADVTGDGQPEFFLGSYSTGIRQLARTGPLAWSLPAQPLYHPRLASVSLMTSPAVADLNGDQLPEIIVGDYDGGVWVLWNRGGPGAPKWTLPQSLPGGDFRAAADTCFDLGDLNRDGLLDMVIAEPNTASPFGAVRVFIADAMTPAPTFHFTAGIIADRRPLLADIGYVQPTPHVVDINADTIPDLLLATPTLTSPRARVHVYLGRDAGNAPAGYNVYHHAPIGNAPLELSDDLGRPIELDRAYNVRLIDLDGDRLPDLILGGTTITWYRNTGRLRHPVFTSAGPILTQSGKPLAGFIAAGDLNDDGRADLVTSPYRAAGLALHEAIASESSPAFADAVTIVTPFAESVFPVIVDLDRDGNDDLILGVRRTGEYHWLRRP